jgi:hypothetical protein
VELYSQLERLVNYAYQQAGISQLAAASNKPAGLDSGEAIRSYEDVFNDRLSSIATRYDRFFVDCALKITDLARDIATREKHYSTVYPGRLGSVQIDLTKADIVNDPVIQIFNANSLPREPGARLAKITEMVQSGMLTIAEGRRLSDFADLLAQETLANAAEERILKQLDDIIEGSGKADSYSPPDSFTDLQLATQIVTQYINLYEPLKLEKEKVQQLRDYFVQVRTLVQASQPPAPPMPPQGAGAPGAALPPALGATGPAANSAPVMQ